MVRPAADFVATTSPLAAALAVGDVVVVTRFLAAPVLAAFAAPALAVDAFAPPALAAVAFAAPVFAADVFAAPAVAADVLAADAFAAPAVAADVLAADAFAAPAFAVDFATRAALALSAAARLAASARARTSRAAIAAAALWARSCRRASARRSLAFRAAARSPSTARLAAALCIDAAAFSRSLAERDTALPAGWGRNPVLTTARFADGRASGAGAGRAGRGRARRRRGGRGDVAELAADPVGRADRPGGVVEIEPKHLIPAAVPEAEPHHPASLRHLAGGPRIGELVRRQGHPPIGEVVADRVADRQRGRTQPGPPQRRRPDLRDHLGTLGEHGGREPIHPVGVDARGLRDLSDAATLTEAGLDLPDRQRALDPRWPGRARRASCVACVELLGAPGAEVVDGLLERGVDRDEVAAGARAASGAEDQALVICREANEMKLLHDVRHRGTGPDPASSGG